MSEVDIKVGDYVVYVNTGTKGRVVDIKKDENGDIWVVLDNNLMYKPNTLEIIEFEEKKEKEIDEKEIEEILEKEKISGIDTNIDACGAG